MYLFEGELDGLILAELQDIHELHDGLVSTVQLVLALDQLFLLLREVDKLVQSFLVDMTVLLQLRVALLQLSEQLLKDFLKTIIYCLHTFMYRLHSWKSVSIIHFGNLWFLHSSVRKCDLMVIEVKGRDKYNEKIAEIFRSERTQKPHREKVNEPLSEGPQRS